MSKFIEIVTSEGQQKRFGCKASGVKSPILEAGDDLDFVNYSYADLCAILLEHKEESFTVKDLLFSMYFLLINKGVDIEKISDVARKRASFFAERDADTVFSHLEELPNHFIDGGSKYFEEVHRLFLKNSAGLEGGVPKGDIAEISQILASGFGEREEVVAHFSPPNGGVVPQKSILPNLFTRSPLAKAFSGLDMESTDFFDESHFLTSEANDLPITKSDIPKSTISLDEVKRSIGRLETGEVVAEVVISYHPITREEGAA